MFSSRLTAFLAIVCFLSAGLNLSAQDFNHYKPLRSEGDMPVKFTISSTEKYRKDVAKKVSKNDKKKDRRAKEQFLLESNFELDNLLLSGKVLFNDPVSLYINRVLDEVLKDEPKLRSEIEAYAVKSPAVNAFCTDNGIILVNIGLIAHLKSEAELAYVLSHEVIHYKKQHSLDEYVESKRIESGSGTYHGTSVDERLLARSNYSKEKESEADIEGLKIYLKSNYSLEAINSAFDILAYSGLPYEDVELQKSLVDRGSLVLAEDYWREKTDSIRPEDDDDSLSSHPAVSKRRVAAMELIKDKANDGRKNFIVSESEFKRIRKIARYESTEQYLQKRQFEAAIYNSYLLLKDDPESEYLQTSIFQGWYSLAKYANNTSLNDVHKDPDEVTGSSQRIYYLVDKISSPELSLVALVHGWNLKKKYPENKTVAAEVNDIFKETVTQHYPKRDFFATALIVTDTTTTEKEELSSGTEEKKPAKKKKKKKKESTMALNALVDLLQDTAFVKQYDMYVNEQEKKITKKSKKKITVELEEPPSLESDRVYVFNEDSGIETYQAAETVKTKKGSVSRMIIVNPFYYYIRETKKTALRYTESEEGQRNFRKLVKQAAEKTGISYTLLDVKNMKTSSTLAFNDIAVLNEFLDRVTDDGEVKRVNHVTDELQAIREKYNTRYVCWTGILAAQVRDDDAANTCVSSVGCPILLPIALFKLLTPDYQTYFFTIVLDLNTGQTTYSRSEVYSIHDDGDVVKGTLYYTFANIKNKSKKKK